MGIYTLIGIGIGNLFAGRFLHKSWYLGLGQAILAVIICWLLGKVFL